MNWNPVTYEQNRLLTWLFAVEYATLNTQTIFNAELTSEGYRQGGLGPGVTTLSNDLVTAMTGGGYSCIPCGITASLGNHTGIVPYTMPDEYGAAITVDVPRYRGIENPFGHLYKWQDGCKVIYRSAADGGTALFYVSDNPANFANTGTDGWEFRGNLPTSAGYISKVLFGNKGDTAPLEIAGSPTTYFSDQSTTSIPAATTERGVFGGGYTGGGRASGFFQFNYGYAQGNTQSHLGELCE